MQHSTLFCDKVITCLTDKSVSCKVDYSLIKASCRQLGLYGDEVQWLLSEVQLPGRLVIWPPRRHITVESISEKAILHRMKFIVVLYGCDSLVEMRLASLLNAIVADGPQPPLVENTMGVKEPCSTTKILLS